MMTPLVPCDLTIAAVADNSVTFPALLMPTDPDGSGL